MDYGAYKAVKELGIELAINTMGDYLRSWGFNTQKSKKKASKQCSKKVQIWLDQEHPLIKVQANGTNRKCSPSAVGKGHWLGD